jgi:hypothetical protein
MERLILPVTLPDLYHSFAYISFQYQFIHQRNAFAVRRRIDHISSKSYYVV